MIIFRNGRMKYEEKAYIHYRDLGGLIVVAEEYKTDLYLVFLNSQGNVQELVKLRKGMDSLKRNSFHEVFPKEIGEMDYLNFLLCLVQKGNLKYLLVYETKLYDEGQGMHSLRSIHEISNGDMIVFSDPGVCKIIPFGINKIFRIVGEQIGEMYLSTEQPNRKKVGKIENWGKSD